MHTWYMPWQYVVFPEPGGPICAWSVPELRHTYNQLTILNHDSRQNGR